jgi:hypothetical protein
VKDGKARKDTLTGGTGYVGDRRWPGNLSLLAF